jgi:hypothetical protein
MELTKIGLVLAKLETTYGTDPVPDATSNNIAVVRGEVTLDLSNEIVRRMILDQGFAKVKGVNTKLAWGLKFKQELRGNRTDGTTADISAGAVGQKLNMDPLLRACDLQPTYTAESSVGNRDGCVIYKPTLPTAGGLGDSVTFYFYSQSKLYKAKGCKGDVSMVFEAGKFPYLEYDFKGLFVAPVDAAVSGLSPVWLNTEPPLLSNPQAYSAQLVAVTFATDKIGLTAHGLQNGDRVKFTASVMPAGLSAATWYYVVAAGVNDFKVSATHGGTAIDITSAGTTVTMDSWPSMVWDLWAGAIFSKADIKLGNAIAQRDSGNHLYGVGGFVNMDRTSSASLDPDSVAEATHPIWTDHISQRNKPLVIQVGTQSGNRVAVDLKTQINKISYSDSNGKRVQSCSLDVGEDQVGRSYGSDFNITFF